MACTSTVCFVLAALGAMPQQTEKARTPLGVLPASTAITIQIPKPGALLKSIVEHPIHERAKKDKVLAAAYASKQMFQVKAGVAFGELAIGMKWPDAVNVLAGNGITLAFDPETNGGIAILESAEPEKLPELLETLKRLGNDQLKKNGDSQIETSDYRGVTVHKVDKVVLAVHKGTLLLTNNKDFGKQVLDTLLDGGADTLANDKNYTTAAARIDSADSITAYVDMTEIKSRGGIDNLLEGLKSNPFAEFLLGGVFEVLADSPYVVAGLQINGGGLKVSARTPHDLSKISEPREFFFGPKGTGRAPAVLPLDTGIGAVSVYRDVSKMWLYAGDLFDQRVNDQFAEAETALSGLFAGKDFVEEILAEIKPGWQIVFARQDFEGVLPQPAIKLPSFALVGQLKDATKMNPELKRTFQSMVGFFNVVGAMEAGNPQLDQDIMVEGDVKYLTSSFVPTPEDKDSTDATVHYNFSPSLALGKNRFVFASSLGLAKKAMKSSVENHAASEEPANFDFRLKAEALKEILGDNREQLVANNMLEEGNTRKEAEQQIDLLLGIVGWFDRFTAKLQPLDDELKMQLDLSLRR